MSTFYRSGDDAPGIAYRRQEPVGNGWGMRAAYRPSGVRPEHVRLDAALRTDLARFDAGFHYSAGRSDTRVGMAGTLLLNADGLFATRDDGGSFATVQLPASGVGIRHDHQLVASSRGDGLAVVSRLRPFERNTLELVIEDLPMDSEPGTGLAVVVPGRRTLTRVAFDASRERHLSARLRLADGSWVPTGASARMDGRDGSEPVGHEGQISFALGAAVGDLQVRWNGRHECRVAAADLPAEPDPTDNPILECKP